MTKPHNITPEPGMKVCSKCHEQKPATTEYFYKKKTPDGLDWYCKTCIAQMDKERYQNNRDKMLQRQKDYNLRNLADVHRRRTPVGLVNTLTKEEWQECLEYFGGKCAYSGREMVHASMDHIVCFTKNGGNEKKNVVPCEEIINRWKLDKDMEEWYRTEFFFDEERLTKIKEWVNGG